MYNCPDYYMYVSSGNLCSNTSTDSEFAILNLGRNNELLNDLQDKLGRNIVCDLNALQRNKSIKFFTTSKFINPLLLWAIQRKVPNLKYINPCNILGKDLVPSGILTKKSPSHQDAKDIAHGIYLLNILKNTKLGQSVIVKNGKVLCLESEVENTYQLIKRCPKIKGKNGVLLILTKPWQMSIFDFPNITTKMLFLAKDANLSGIVVNSQACTIKNSGKIVQIANKEQLFMLGISQNE